MTCTLFLRYMVETVPASDWPKLVLNKCWHHHSFCLWVPQNPIALKRNILECIINPAAVIYNTQCPLRASFTQVPTARSWCACQRKQKFPRKTNKEICALKRRRRVQELAESYPKWCSKEPQSETCFPLCVCTRYIELPLFCGLSNKKTVKQQQ